MAFGNREHDLLRMVPASLLAWLGYEETDGET